MSGRHQGPPKRGHSTIGSVRRLGPAESRKFFARHFLGSFAPFERPKKAKKVQKSIAGVTKSGPICQKRTLFPKCPHRRFLTPLALLSGLNWIRRGRRNVRRNGRGFRRGDLRRVAVGVPSLNGVAVENA